MAHRAVMGASVAAALPAALAAAVLISAPFAGTTTTPLGDTHQAHRHSVHRDAHDQRGRAKPERGPRSAAHKAKR